MREPYVRRLMEAAHAGMESGSRDCTSDEVLSAYMTMASQAIRAAKRMGAPSERLRMVVGELYLLCDDANQQVM